jgi:hypothetical protein
MLKLRTQMLRSPLKDFPAVLVASAVIPATPSIAPP